MSRRLKRLPEPLYDFVALVRRGKTLKEAAEGIGHNMPTIAHWRKVYRGFDKAIKEAETAYAVKAANAKAAAKAKAAGKGAKAKSTADVGLSHVVRRRITTSPDGTVTEELKTKPTDLARAIKILRRPTEASDYLRLMYPEY